MSIGHGVKRITEKQLEQWVTMIADQQDYLAKLNILLPILQNKDEIQHTKYLQGITAEAIEDYKKTYNKLLLSYNRNQAHIRVALKLLAIDLPQKVELDPLDDILGGFPFMVIDESKYTHERPE